MFCDSEGTIDGAVNGTGAGGVSTFDVVCVVGVDGIIVAGEVDETAAAAAAAYRIGGNDAGGRGAGGKPAFNMLDIGCCAKLGFGGGFAESTELFQTRTRRERNAYALLLVKLLDSVVQTGEDTSDSKLTP